MVYPNGNTENYTYYADSLLKELVNKKADGSIIDNYTYDAAHNQTSKQELVNGVNKGITSYKYDNLNRLEIVEEPGRTTAYTFDMAGNRETVTVAAQSVITIYTYNDQNRLEKTVTQSAGKTEKAMMQTEICIKGKLSIKECTNRSTCKCYSSHFQHWKITYKYDNWNQLIKTLSDKTTTYAYNAEDYRVEKTVNNKLTRYLYEADKVVLETDGTGTETARNVYGTNLLYRSVEANETSPAEQYYYLYNAHGDVTALADTEGAISATYDYDAFGNIISQTGNANNSITYAGYQYDKETELYYLNARYYDSKTARFLTEDTYAGQASDPMSLNLYTYCANEPILYFDPTGHWVQGDEKLNDESKAKIISIDIAIGKVSTTGEKDALRAEADAVRNENDAYDTDKDTLVTIKNEDKFVAAMNKALKDGRISKKEYEDALRLINIKVKTSTVTTTSRTTTPNGTFENKSSTKYYNVTIGRTDIKVGASTTKPTDSVSYSSIVTVTNHYSVYVFYMASRKDAKDDEVKRLASYYGIGSGDIGTAVVGSDREFMSLWNSIGSNDKVSAVVINSHADEEGLYFGGDGLSTSDISNLDNKNIGILILSGCNAGYLGNKNNNPAANFAKKIRAGYVIASDGTDINGPKFFGTFGCWLYSSCEDDGFQKINKKYNTQRRNSGWIIYQYNAGKISTQTGLGRSITLSGMLGKMKEKGLIK